MFLQIEGKRGTGFKEIGEKGAVIVNMTSNIYDKKYICVEAFEGRGDMYKERETPAIIIQNGNERFEFKSLDELIVQLKK
ncbi:MAG: hypothetical protein K0R54_244 [Clostridiaceae bacterium]|jgi:hypothetical protein|nr:hypothetical protein [Clostridiaceae bacterium]